MIVVPGVLHDDACRWGERLRAIGEAPVFVGELELVLDVAVGLVHVVGDGLDATSVLGQAGVALGRAREVPGRSLMLPATDGRLPGRFRLLRSFAAALRSDRGIELHHQTQWGLPDLEIVGTEALIRWTACDGVEVLPMDFIPVVEQTPMIGALTRWVLDHAALDAHLSAPAARAWECCAPSPSTHSRSTSRL